MHLLRNCVMATELGFRTLRYRMEIELVGSSGGLQRRGQKEGGAAAVLVMTGGGGNALHSVPLGTCPIFWAKKPYNLLMFLHRKEVILVAPCYIVSFYGILFGNK